MELPEDLEIVRRILDPFGDLGERNVELHIGVAKLWIAGGNNEREQDG